MTKVIFTGLILVANLALAEGPRVLSEPTVATANDVQSGGSSELAVEVPKTPESAIPVRLKAQKGEPDASSDLQRRVWLGLALILGTAALSFVLLRKYRVIGNKKTEQFNMKILSQHHLGPRKSLAVIRVAGESILIGVTDHHISMIKSLSLLDEDVPEETPKVFSKVFDKKNQSVRDEFLDGGDLGSTEVDAFALSSIQDVVSKKVKNLRNL